MAERRAFQIANISKRGKNDRMQDYRADLSDAHFDAFISYKHNDKDSAAALALQKALEKYRAPRGLSENRVPFKRVFVDEGEFSSCADFGQQLNYAIMNSQWLIVVCSEDTPNSPWVQLEIETFLKYHDRSRILAVLTGGDPESSFPPQLKGGAGGQGEVLAAGAQGKDAREVCRKIRGDALLKIAAPMLGVNFGDLKNRQKIYFFQKIAALMAALTLLGVFFSAYTMNQSRIIKKQKIQIEQEYERAMVNESLFLAEQAVRRVNDDDPVSAAELALKALPSKEQDRPVMAEARYALGRVLGLYRSPKAAEGTALVTGIIEHEYDKFFLDESGKYLILWGGDFQGIQVWDAESLELLGHYLKDDYISSCSKDLLLDEGRMILGTALGDVVAIDYISGEELWRRNSEELLSLRKLIGLTVSEDKTQIGALCGKTYFDPEDELSGIKPELRIEILDSLDGSSLQNTELELAADRYMSFEKEICFSSDKKQIFIAAAAAVGTEEATTDKCFIQPFAVNLETGECRPITEMDSSLMLLENYDDKIVVLRRISSSYNFTIKQENRVHEYKSPYRILYECYDADSLELLWRYEEEQDFFVYKKAFAEKCSYDSGEKQGEGFLFICGDRSLLLDCESGELMAEYRLSAHALDMRLRENGYDVVTADGKVQSSLYDRNYTMSTPFSDKNFSAAIISGDTIFSRSDETYFVDRFIRRYSIGAADENYVPMFEIESNAWELYACRAKMGSTQAVFIRNDELAVYNELFNRLEIHDVPGLSYYDLVGIDWDKMLLIGSCYSSEDDYWLGYEQFYTVDMRSGDVRLLDCPKKPAGLDRTIDSVYQDGQIIIACEVEGEQGAELKLLSWDMRSAKTRELYSESYKPGETFRSSKLWKDSYGGKLWIASGGDDVQERELLKRALIFDTKELAEFVPDKDIYLPEFYSSSIVCDSAEGICAIGFDGVFYIMNAQEGKVQEIEAEETIENLRFFLDGSHIISVSESGQLSAYDCSDGSLVSRRELAEYGQIRQDSLVGGRYRWQDMGDDMSILYCGFDNSAVVLDLSEPKASIDCVLDLCCGYDSRKDRFIMGCNSGGSFGSFKRYSTEEIVEKANEFLNR